MTLPSRPEYSYAMPVTQGSAGYQIHTAPSLREVTQAVRVTTQMVADYSAQLVVTTVCGDYTRVMANAKECPSVRRWIRRQNVQATLPMIGVGALVALQPQLFLPASLGGVLWVTRRMAHTTWGVGSLMGKEVDPITDLFGTWAVLSGMSIQKVQQTYQRVGPAAFGRWRTMLPITDTRRTKVRVDAAFAFATLLLTKLGADRFELARRLLKMAEAAKLVVVPAVGGIMAGAGTAFAMRGVGDAAQLYYRHKQ